MRSTKLQFGISALGVAVLGAAVWFGVGFAQTIEHRRPRSTPRQGDESTRAIAPPPLVMAPSTLSAAAPKTASPPLVMPRTAAITNDEFLNRHYQNQVVADVKPLDTPEQIVQKVRALDPDYAKILDENAAAERAAEMRSIPAPPQRPGNDSER